MTRPFESWLADHFERFIAVKRAGGAVYGSQRDLLLAFDRFLCRHAPEPPLEREALLRYLASSERTPRARSNVVSVLWQALAHARRHGARVERLPERPPKPPLYWRRRQPRIVSSEEMKRWLRAAHDLPPAEGWRGVTIATLLGLLYVTGIRIGEALALDVAALDRANGVLTVVRGKFRKSRALPLRPSTVQALACYIDRPLRPMGAAAASPIFVSTRRRRLSQPAPYTRLAPSWARLPPLRTCRVITRPPARSSSSAPPLYTRLAPSSVASAKSTGAERASETRPSG